METTLTPKQQGVVQAATEVFLRYGFARTTMGDLAEAAGMSRPALYLVFPGKEEVFGAVIAEMSRQLLTELRSGLLALRTPGEKLSFVCRTWGARGYELTIRYPDSRDILDLSFEAVRSAYADFQALLVEVLAEARQRTIVSSAREEVARVIIYAIRGFTEAAKDREDFIAMIETQVRLVVHALLDDD